MSVKLRLTRMGAKKAPFYRIVAIDNRKARDAQYLDNIGYFNPIKEELKIDAEKANYWIGVGAQPSETVKSLLKKENLIK